MKLLTNGHNRWVLLTKSRAYKFPALYSWRALLYGLLNNMNEKTQGRGKDRACPVLWGLPGGLLIVMPRCSPLANHENCESYARLFAQHGIVVEAKLDSFGYLKGQLVAVDYGWPRELVW